MILMADFAVIHFAEVALGSELFGMLLRHFMVSLSCMIWTLFWPRVGDNVRVSGPSLCRHETLADELD